MYKTVIIDDEPLARSIAREYLLAHSDVEIVAECDNGFEGVKAIRQHQPQLILLDIQMPKINGFEMLELLDEEVPVIFTTAFDEYALKAFESNAVDYLLKPFSKERFDAALRKFRAQPAGARPAGLHQLMSNAHKQPAERDRIVVRNGAEIKIVPTADIHYIEAFDDYVKIFTGESYFLKKKTMSYYEEALDGKTFFRTHRSFIINLKQLTKIEPLEKNTYLAILKAGSKVPLSRNAYLKLKERLGI
jgi:two-component system, LytTR family, response regulator